MTRKECLEILELPVGASRDEIVKTYRHLAQVWHPDRFPNNPELQQKAHVKLSKINEAYSTLIEGRATPDKNTESSRNERSNAAPNPNAPAPYRDEQVRYFGCDPRLKLLYDWPSSFSSEGVPAIIEVSSEGVTLVTFNGQLADESICYPASSLLAVEDGTNQWIRRGIQILWGHLPPLHLHVHLYFSDPEGIHTRPIDVNLKVRNAYFAQLLLKRLQPLADLEKWTPPPPPPPPKPTPPPTTQLPSDPSPDFFERVCLHPMFPTAAGLALTLIMILIAVALSSVPSPPSNAQTKNSFTVWTENSNLMIRVRLPPEMTVYHFADDLVITDGGQAWGVKEKGGRLVNSGFAVVAVPLPGPKRQPWWVSVESKRLNEKEWFDIGSQQANELPNQDPPPPLANEQTSLSSSPLHASITYSKGGPTVAGFVLLTQLAPVDIKWQKDDAVTLRMDRTITYFNTGGTAGTIPAGKVGKVLEVSGEDILIEFPLPRPLRLVKFKPWHLRRADTSDRISKGMRARIDVNDSTPLLDAKGQTVGLLRDGYEVVVESVGGQ